MKNCIDRTGVSNLCEYKEFPHSQRCNFVLLKTVELASRKKVLYPNNVYCYNSLKSSQPDFAALCEHWRKRKVGNGILSMAVFGKIFAVAWPLSAIKAGSKKIHAAPPQEFQSNYEYD